MKFELEFELASFQLDSAKFFPAGEKLRTVQLRTYPDIYKAFKVPELWRFDRGLLQLSVLQAGDDVLVDESPNFPNLPLIEANPQYLAQCRVAARNTTLKAFLQWVRIGNSINSKISVGVDLCVYPVQYCCD